MTRLRAWLHHHLRPVAVADPWSSVPLWRLTRPTGPVRLPPREVILNPGDRECVALWREAGAL